MGGPTHWERKRSFGITLSCPQPGCRTAAVAEPFQPRTAVAVALALTRQARRLASRMMRLLDCFRRADFRPHKAFPMRKAFVLRP